MATPFCDRCRCVVDDDRGLCIQCAESELDAEASGREKPMDCAFPCNGICRDCKKPVVHVTMVPEMEVMALQPTLEHGGNIEVRRNGIGKLYGKDTGPDIEERKMILHSEVCKGSWESERSKMIQGAIGKLK